MKQLIGIECKKILRSATYWIYVLVLVTTFLLNYGNIEEKQIKNANDSTSLFYVDPNNEYAAEVKDLDDESQQQEMMVSVTKRLISCYRDNSYEYYPFGYVKEKTLSENEQNKVLQYLKEITGMDEETIKGDEETQSDEINVSGGGAYVMGPNKGSMNENGQFIAEPEDWEYVEDPTISGSASEDEKAYEELSIKISYERFKKIMRDVNEMIGKNSYFSWSLINLYYGQNDMENTPITANQHDEFFNKDKITGAFARYYCDSISLAILWLPAFVVVSVFLKDKRSKIQDLVYTHTITSSKIVLIRFFSSIFMMMLPILLLPIKSQISLVMYAKANGYAIDLLAFPKYIVGWILPTVLFIAAVTLLLTMISENYISLLITGVIWFLGRPSIEKISGGNYGIFDLVIRHNTLKGYSRVVQNMDILVVNRVLLLICAIALVMLSVYVYQIKRKGGMTFGIKKLVHDSEREL